MADSSTGSGHFHHKTMSSSLKSVEQRRAREEESIEHDDDVREWMSSKLNNPKYLDKSTPLQSMLMDGVDLCKFAQ